MRPRYRGRAGPATGPAAARRSVCTARTSRGVHGIGRVIRLRRVEMWRDRWDEAGGRYRAWWPKPHNGARGRVPQKWRPAMEHIGIDVRRLFGLFVEENTRGMPNPTTIDLKEEQRSDKAWARLTTKQMKAEIHQLAANKKLRIKIKSEVGAIIVLQWIRPPR